MVSIKDDTPFDNLEIWNEYQYGSTTFNKGSLLDSLKKKFRLWRIQLPRDVNSKYKNDRIRSPWAHIKMSKENVSNKMVFHNLTLKYFK